MLSEVNYKALGERIKTIRKEKGLTQENLAEKIGCNTSHISNIENDYTKLSLNALVAIANALEVSIDYLLSEQIAVGDSAIDQEIMKQLKSCNESDKEKILQIVKMFVV